MSHRQINNVGYKKIYPMSLHEDDNFCHYCGRTANLTRALHWDHVPALNVRIPEGCDDIRKTLVRACSECNSLASDLPHLDYLERHLALKTLLIQRYHRLLLSSPSDSTELGLSEEHSYLHAAIHNIVVTRAELFSAIGFGIHDIEQIESPFMRRKNADGVTLESLLLEHLTPTPSEMEPEEDTLLRYSELSTSNQEPSSWNAAELKNFIRVENRALHREQHIVDQQSYVAWLRDHPTRSLALELPEDPQLIPGFCWAVNDLKTA